MRALVTGANGQVGREIVESLLNLGIETIDATSKALDITKDNLVLSAVTTTDVDIVINAAAYTNVDMAQDEKDKAISVNVTGVENLAKACSIADIPFIHLSTDYVFFMPTGIPHCENDMATPNGVYAKTKYEGEKRALSLCKKSIVVRASWIFGRYGKNFVKTMQRLARTNDELNVVFDQKGNPTPARAFGAFIANLAKLIILNKSFDLYGIYHFAGEPYTTWDEFARLILDLSYKKGYIDHKVKINSIASSSYPMKIERPSDSRLNCSLIKERFNVDMPSWMDYIEETIDAEFKEFSLNENKKS